MCCTPAPREDQNYLTTIAGTVKKKVKSKNKKRERVHVQRCVQWPFTFKVFKQMWYSENRRQPKQPGWIDGR